MLIEKAINVFWIENIFKDIIIKVESRKNKNEITIIVLVLAVS